ncbi:hypothetical protein MRB53_028535 [Persea americana]|uniref:Uncharacterized protein n=1 Tax=Persea americana TaxID=3435 RepID=A0ACC2KFV1_PERAE|nr:hypothetical protein MRB53_028535 [Persea americana]
MWLFLLQAIDDAGHDKVSLLKVRALEAVDKAIGQLARLLWQAESTGKFQYSLLGGEAVVMATPLDPFPLPEVKAGEDLKDQLEVSEATRNGECKAFGGDSVSELNEIAAARGCLGRFPGSEMMGVIKKFIQMDL